MIVHTLIYSRRADGYPTSVGSDRERLYRLYVLLPPRFLAQCLRELASAGAACP
jgi:hypothetical protein